MARLIKNFEEYVTVGTYLGIDPLRIRNIYTDISRENDMFEAAWNLFQDWWGGLENIHSIQQKMPEILNAFQKIGKVFELSEKKGEIFHS